MLRMACSLTLFVILVFSSSTVLAAFFEEQEDGWHWYQDPESSEVMSEQKANNLEVFNQNPTEIVKQYQQELEKRLHRAWVNPTRENLRAYQLLQKDLLERSEHFSKTWMEVIYHSPELDHTLVSPVNQQARQLYLDEQREATKALIQTFKENYGLFYFFSSTCPYCHQFAPIVQRFSRETGWNVIAISVDGGMVPGFEEVVLDNGLSERWNVRRFPALFAINPKEEQVLPIAYGLVSLDEIEDRLRSLLEAVK